MKQLIYIKISIRELNTYIRKPNINGYLIAEDIFSLLKLETNNKLQYLGDKNGYTGINIINRNETDIVHIMTWDEAYNAFIDQVRLYGVSRSIDIGLPYVITIIKHLYTSNIYGIDDVNQTIKEFIYQRVMDLASLSGMAIGMIWTNINCILRDRYGVDIFKLKKKNDELSIPKYIEANPAIAPIILMELDNMIQRYYNFHAYKNIYRIQEDGSIPIIFNPENESPVLKEVIERI